MNIDGTGEGIVWQHTAAADISSNDVVVMEDTVAVALVDIATGKTGSVQVGGKFPLTKKAAGAINQGKKVYWDATNGEVTSTATGNTHCGYAALAAADGDTVISVKLLVG